MHRKCTGYLEKQDLVFLEQRGGLKCTEPATWTPFKWSANSCWLDSFLLALLHHPNKKIDDIIKKATNELTEQISVAKQYNKDSLKLLKNKEVILDRMSYIRAHLRNAFDTPFDDRNSERKLAKLREEIRDTLATCPGGTIFKKGLFSSISEIWQFIVRAFNIPETIRFIERVGNNPRIEGKQTYVGFSGFDLIGKDELHIIDHLTKPQQQETRTYQYKRFGDLLPIDVERMGGFEENTQELINVPIIVEEYINLKTSSDTISRYRLVSVICNTGGHYVTYIACDEGDDWMFYNDMGGNEDDRIIPVGTFDEWWNAPIPGYRSKFPANYSTWFLYIKQ